MVHPGLGDVPVTSGRPDVLTNALSYYNLRWTKILSSPYVLAFNKVYSTILIISPQRNGKLAQLRQVDIWSAAPMGHLPSIWEENISELPR